MNINQKIREELINLLNFNPQPKIIENSEILLTYPIMPEIEHKATDNISPMIVEEYQEKQIYEEYQEKQIYDVGAPIYNTEENKEIFNE